MHERMKILLFLLAAFLFVGSASAQDLTVDGLEFESVNESFESDHINFRTSYMNQNLSAQQVFVPDRLDSMLSQDVNYNLQEYPSDPQVSARMRLMIRYTQNPQNMEESYPSDATASLLGNQQSEDYGSNHFTYDQETQAWRNDGRENVFDTNMGSGDVEWNISVSSHYEHLIVNYDLVNNGEVVDSFRDVYSDEDTLRIPFADANTQHILYPDQNVQKQSLSYDNRYESDHNVTVALAVPEEDSVRSLEFGSDYENVTDSYGYSDVEDRVQEAGLSDELLMDSRDGYKLSFFNTTIQADSVQDLEAYINTNSEGENQVYMWVLGSSGGSTTLYETSDIHCGETLNQNNTGWRACQFQSDISSGTSIKLPHIPVDGVQSNFVATLVNHGEVAGNHNSIEYNPDNGRWYAGNNDGEVTVLDSEFNIIESIGISGTAYPFDIEYNGSHYYVWDNDEPEINVYDSDWSIVDTIAEPSNYRTFEEFEQLSNGNWVIADRDSRNGMGGLQVYDSDFNHLKTVNEGIPTDQARTVFNDGNGNVYGAYIAEDHSDYGWVASRYDTDMNYIDTDYNLFESENTGISPKGMTLVNGTWYGLGTRPYSGYDGVITSYSHSGNDRDTGLIPARLYDYPDKSKLDVKSKELGGVSYLSDGSNRNFANWTLQQSWSSGEEIRYAVGGMTEFDSSGSKDVDVRFDSVPDDLKMNFTGSEKYGGDGDLDTPYTDGYLYDWDNNSTTDMSGFRAMGSIGNLDSDPEMEITGELYHHTANEYVIYEPSTDNFVDTGYHVTDGHSRGGVYDIDGDGVSEATYDRKNISSNNMYMAWYDYQEGSNTDVCQVDANPDGGMAVEDIDGDSTLEIVSGRGGDLVICEIGSGTKTTNTNIGTGDGIGNNIKDYDGDGNLELAYAESWGNLKIWDFGSSSSTDTGIGAKSVSGFYDVDDDNNLEIVFTGTSPYRIMYYDPDTDTVTDPGFETGTTMGSSADFGSTRPTDPSASFGSQFWSYSGTFSGEEQSSDFSGQVSEGVNTMSLSSNQKGKIGYFVDYETEPDVITPTTSDNYSETGWQSSDTVLEFSIDELADLFYRINGGDWTRVNDTQSVDVSIDSYGNNTVEYYAVDEAGNNESINTENVLIGDKPDVSVSTNITSIQVNETVGFEGGITNSHGTIGSKDWDFDSDGSVDATGLSVKKRFSEAGTYEVSFNVSENDTPLFGSESKTLNVYVNVSETLFDVKQDDSRASSSDAQYVFRNKQLENLGNGFISGYSVSPPSIMGSCSNCGAGSVGLDGLQKKNLTFNASGDWIENESVGSMTDATSKVLYGEGVSRNYTSVQNVTAANNNSEIGFDVDLGSLIPSSNGCSVENSTTKNIPVDTEEVFSFHKDCSPAEESDYNLVKTVTNNSSMYEYNGTVEVYSDRTSEVEHEYWVKQSRLNEFDNRNESTVKVSISGIDQGVRTRTDSRNGDDYLVFTALTNRTQSSVHSGTQYYSYEYNISESSDGSSGGGGSGGSDQTEVTESPHDWSLTLVDSDYVGVFKPGVRPGESFEKEIIVTSQESDLEIDVGCESEGSACDWVSSDISQVNFDSEGQTIVTVKGTVPEDAKKSTYRFEMVFTDPAYESGTSVGRNSVNFVVSTESQWDFVFEYWNNLTGFYNGIPISGIAFFMAMMFFVPAWALGKLEEYPKVVPTVAMIIFLIVVGIF